MNKKRIINIIGLVLMAVSIVFLVRRILTLNVNLADLFTPASTAVILLLALASVGVVFLNALCWQLCLRLFSDAPISIRDTFSVYAKANIMKYLPGNVGHYAGRQFYGAQLGLKQPQLAAATILEVAYSALAMLLSAFCFSAQSVVQAIRERFSGTVLLGVGIVVVLAAAVVGIGLFAFRKNEYIRILLRLIGSLRFWGTFFLCTLLNITGSLIITIGYILLLSQHIALDFYQIPLLLSANYVAIFVGFITPGVPGGIGVRETMLAALLAPYFPEAPVLLAAFAHRIATTLMDLLAVPVSGLFAHRRGSKEEKKP